MMAMAPMEDVVVATDDSVVMSLFGMPSTFPCA